MALIPGTLPSDTCYGTPQDLLELFAQYLDIPAFALNSKVVFSTSTPAATDVIWIDITTSSNPILKISNGSFVDYISNYVKNATIVTSAANDYALIQDVSDSDKTKKALVGELGKVVQIVEGSTTTAVTVNTTTPTDTGLTVTITPTSASNKVLIIITQSTNIYRAQSSQAANLKVLRGATTLYSGSTADMYMGVGNSTSVQILVPWSFTYLDSPATTSATVYKVQGNPTYTANGGYAAFQTNAERSTILAIEVRA